MKVGQKTVFEIDMNHFLQEIQTKKKKKKKKIGIIKAEKGLVQREQTDKKQLLHPR